MKKKIFCEPCEYHGETTNGVVSRECYHPKNLEDNWFDEKFATVRRAHEINQDNDCNWFKKHEE